MTQNSNRDTYTPWGEPAAPSATSAWASLVTVPALLGHIVLMLCVMSVLTVVNLLVNPGTWWSLAILLVWFTLVIIHGLAMVSLGVILEDDAEEAERPPRVHAEPTIPPQALNGWRISEPAADAERPDDASDPGPWRAAPPVAGPVWSEVAAQPDARDGTTDDENQDFMPLKIDHDTGKGERIPWRAVTDIAWLRRRSQGDDDASDNGRKASS